jgi:hypothetical protein
MGSATPPIRPSSSTLVSLSKKKQEGRVINSVASYLRSHLRVPNVYIEPKASFLKRVDVLAVDAAGSGDLHAVEIKLFHAPPGVAMFKQYIEEVKAIPAHFKYVAMPHNGGSLSLGAQLFAADGIGRIGLFLFAQSDDSFPAVELAIKPERFRMQESDLLRVEHYLESTKPDMFVRV